MNRTFCFVLAGVVIAGSVGAVAMAIPPGRTSTPDTAKSRIESTDRFNSDRTQAHSGWERMEGRYDRSGNCFLMADGGMVRGLSQLDKKGRFVATNVWHGQQAFGAPNLSGAYVLDGKTLSVYLVRPGSELPIQFPKEDRPFSMVFEDQ